MVKCAFCKKNEANSKLSPNLCIDCHQFIAEYNGRLTAGEPCYSINELRKISQHCLEHHIFYPNEPIGDLNAYVAGMKEVLLLLKDREKVERVLSAE